ncbi:hypothetical protein QZH41_017800, partial [Actinostola sp. cb2023]
MVCTYMFLFNRKYFYHVETTIEIPKCLDRRKRKCRLYSKFVGYCTVYKKYMAEVCPKSCGFCVAEVFFLGEKDKYFELEVS